MYLIRKNIVCLPLINVIIPVKFGVDVSVDPAVVVVVASVTPPVLVWVVSNKYEQVKVDISKRVIFTR